MEDDKKILIDLLSEVIAGFSPEKVFFAEESPPPPGNAIMPNRTRILIGVEGVRNNIFSYRGKITNMEMRSGDILYASPPTWHKPTRGKPHSLINIIFDREYTNIVWKGDAIPSPMKQHYNSYLPPINQTTPEIFYLLQAINSIEHPNERAFAPTLLKALLEITQNYMNLLHDKPLNKPRTTWISVCNYLDDNFHRNAISRESVAEVFNMHPNHLSRLFKMHGKESFSGRLNRLRMENALLLLKTDKTASIKEIADKCGFDSANYFCRTFKRFAGKTPGKYQRA